MTPYEKMWLERRHPNHDAWLAKNGRLKDAIAHAQPAPEPTEEEKLAAIVARNEAIDAEVKATVKAYFPHLLDPAERRPKPADPQNELDREVGAIAESYLRSRGR